MRLPLISTKSRPLVDPKSEEIASTESPPATDGPFGDYKLRLCGKTYDLNKKQKKSWRLLNAFWEVRLDAAIAAEHLTGLEGVWESMPSQSNIGTSASNFKNEMPPALPWGLHQSGWEIVKRTKSRPNHAT